MKVAIFGAGVIGVTSAYFLAREGHDVTVYEERGSVADDTSASTAGLIAPGHSYAWASPQAPRMLVRSLFGGQTSIRVKPRLDPALLRWGVSFLRECTPARSARNSSAKYEITSYSQKLLEKLTAEESLQYHQTDQGVLYLYRDAEALALADRKAELMRRNGRSQRMLSGADLAAVDPALANSTVSFAGAIHDSDDATGNPALFSKLLADTAAERFGVKFELGTRITALHTDGTSVRYAETDAGTRLEADCYVVALGTASNKLVRTAGLRVPVYPAKGYSVSVAIRDQSLAPRTGGIDERSLVAWSPFGSTLRLSAVAEFAGYDRTHTPANFAEIRTASEELFPGALDWSSVEYRSGLRPMTPDGPPIIGATPLRNLQINTGHGHLGWTMCCGAAALLAASIGGQDPEIDSTPYRFDRF
ncbi:D-amino acid dehydrogenase [Mycolicibacterium mengxianglii]|uniref:D-amino acid dehydrogenase n=1 Tax=Mycolicibacterium mengxianglii TaxID=2736649 RepID=UPI0018EEE487|nr:D-amino acid dehydrogenase [Mycolicibacterium mengxianglii]